MSKIFGIHVRDQGNRAYNGGFDFFQRFEGNNFSVAATSSSQYVADMWQVSSNTTSSRSFVAARSPTVPTVAQAGYQSNYSMAFTMSTGFASPVAGDFVIPFNYRMEGLDYAAIHTRNVTFGFWVYATVAGVYTLALQNNAGGRSYVTTFTVNGSLTWQYVTVPVTMDSGGTWLFGVANVGLQVIIGAVTGTTYQTPTLNTWQSAAYAMASTAVNWQATTGAVLQIAQFSIVDGFIGAGALGFQRSAKSYQAELAQCQRYYEKSFLQGTAPAQATGSISGALSFSVGSSGAGNWEQFIQYAALKCSAPGATTYNPISANANWRDTTNNADRTQIGITTAGNNGFGIAGTFVVTSTNAIHWTADAGI